MKNEYSINFSHAKLNELSGKSVGGQQEILNKAREAGLTPASYDQYAKHQVERFAADLLRRFKDDSRESVSFDAVKELIKELERTIQPPNFNFDNLIDS